MLDFDASDPQPEDTDICSETLDFDASDTQPDIDSETEDGFNPQEDFGWELGQEVSSIEADICWDSSQETEKYDAWDPQGMFLEDFFPELFFSW